MAAAGHWDIVAKQGATFSKVLTYRDAAGALVNLTGKTARMQIRDGYDTTEALISLTTENGGITLGGAAGTITLAITATVMGAIVVAGASRTFLQDFQLIDGASVVQLWEGKFTVPRSVTR